MKIVIRNESASDIDVISDITKAAFADCPYGNHTEQFIIKALRAANALSVSLVAELDGQVIGHIAFSPVTMADGSPGWYGLGPVAVVPKLQKRGVGKALINEGLSVLKSLGASGCVLVGDPAYYERFGFRSIAGLCVEGVPQENCLALAFTGIKVSGAVAFHEGFIAQC